MDINDEKEIGRKIRDLANECGFDLMPGGFQIVVNLDSEGDDVVAHLILTSTSERIAEVLADKQKDEEQKKIDAMFNDIAREAVRDDKKAELDDVINDLKGRLQDGGEFL